MDAWIIWLIIAVVMIVLEVITQWIWTFCLAVGAVIALVFSFFDVTLPVQIGIAALSSVLAYFICVPFISRWYSRLWHGRERADRTGMEALLGRKALVVHEIKPGGIGRARIDGDCWQVRAPGVSSVVPSGAYMSVTGYDSIILTVEPIKD